jgi:DNA ligase 1
MKPMLAKKYNDYKDRILYPVTIQPKLNGVRALYWKGEFQSRDEKRWSTRVLYHLAAPLSNIIPDHIILDGELYLHGLSLQQINSAVAVRRNDVSPITRSIEYHVFDCIDTLRLDLPFPDRHAILLRYLPYLTPPIVIVPTFLSCDAGLANSLYPEYRRDGYEGTMYRDNSAPYGLSHACSNKENRWPYLLKRKEFLDDEFEITDVYEEISIDGIPKGTCGGLILETKDGKPFRAGSGLTRHQRHYYWQHPPIGLLATIRYETLSDSGIPLKPTIEVVL